MDFSADGLMSYRYSNWPEVPLESGVRIVDPLSGDVINSFPFDEEIFFTQWSPDGSRLAVGNQATIHVIDASTGEVMSRLGESGRVFRPEWLRDGDRYVVGGELPPRIVDAATGQFVLELAGLAGGSFDYDVVPGTDLLAVASLSGDGVAIFDVSEIGGTEIGGWVSPFPDPRVRYTPDGARVFVGGGNFSSGPYLVANALDGADPREGAGTLDRFNDAGTYITGDDAEGAGSSVVRDVETDQIIYRAPAGWRVQGVNADASRAIMNNESCDQLRMVSPVDGSFSVDLDITVQCDFVVVFSPDGELAYLLGWVFDTSTGEVLFNVSGDYFSWSGGFSADGSELITGGFGGPLFVFDLPALLGGASLDDALLREIAAHDAFVLTVELSPDESMVASVSWNEPVKIWDHETWEPLGEFGADPGNDRAHWFAFHPHLPQLMVSSPDGTIRIHTLDVDELMSIAESKFSRAMTNEECQLYLRGPCPAS